MHTQIICYYGDVSNSFLIIDRLDRNTRDYWSSLWSSYQLIIE